MYTDKQISDHFGRNFDEIDEIAAKEPFLVQSALLGWFGGLASLKHYGIKVLWQ